MTSVNSSGGSHGSSGAPSNKWAGFRKNDRAANGSSGKDGGSSNGGGAQDHPVFTKRDRMLYVCQALLGVVVKVQLKNGSVYEGVLSAVNTKEKEFGVRLSKAMKRMDAGGKRSLPNRPVEDFFIRPTDLVMITTSSDVCLDDATIARPGEGKDGKGSDAMAGTKAFTDSDISRGAGGAGRDLERWVPDADGPEMVDLSLGGRPGHGGRGGAWDQFEANKRLYGVQSTFKEEMYTTALDKSNSRISVAEADRIAREIERQGANGNMHLAEERGHVIDGTSGEMDEEDRYSSVLDSSRPGQAKPPTGNPPAPETKLQSPPGAAPTARATAERTNAAKPTGAEMPDSAEKDAGAAKVPASASKLNANAKEFKLNVNAASFTPGAKKPSVAPALVPPPMQNVQMMQQYGVGNEFGAGVGNPAMYMPNMPMMPGGYFPGQATGMGYMPPGAPHMGGFPQQQMRGYSPQQQQQHFQQQQQGGG